MTTTMLKAMEMLQATTMPQHTRLSTSTRLYEGLRSRFEMVQTHIATDYAHVIGDATVIEALESLQAAVNRSDGEAFETVYSSLNMAVTALTAPEDSD
jgi:hypothetical protein